MVLKYEVKQVTYKDWAGLVKILNAFSINGWNVVETKKHEYYNPLGHYTDDILFSKEV